MLAAVALGVGFALGYESGAADSRQFIKTELAK